MNSIALLADRARSSQRRTGKTFPPWYIGAASPVPVTLDSLERRHSQITDAIDAARRWRKRLDVTPEASLILASSTKGVGKTHIAESILWSVQVQAPDGLGGTRKTPAFPMFESTQLLIKAHELIQAGQRLDSIIRPAESVVNGVRQIDPFSHKFIVIDDLGQDQKPQFVAKDNWNETRQSIWFSVINHCYTKKIGLVITTNLTHTPNASGHTLGSWIGDAAFSRLMEMAPRGFMIDMSDVSDYRLHVKNRRH